MIETLVLRNFKTHVDSKLDLGPFTLLVGPNASGKTGALQGIQLASYVGHLGFHSEHFSGPRAPSAVCRHGAENFSVGLTSSVPSPWRLKLEMTLEQGHWRPTMTSKWDQQPEVITDPRQPHPATGVWGAIQEIRPHIRPAEFLRFDQRRLAAPTTSQWTDHDVDYRGYGLATMLASMKLSEDPRFDSVVQLTRKVIPNLRNVRLRIVPAVREDDVRDSIRDRPPETAHEILFDFEGATAVPAHAVSEGTLFALGFLTMLHSWDGPRLLLMDDIEHALHPRAQRALVRALRDTQQVMKGVQIVATTHSPYVVDECDPASVWVFGLREGNQTAARQLSSHPEAAHALEVLTAGEFWTAEGESWVTRP